MIFGHNNRVTVPISLNYGTGTRKPNDLNRKFPILPVTVCHRSKKNYNGLNLIGNHESRIEIGTGTGR
jgi:hypothetical protein